MAINKIDDFENFYNLSKVLGIEMNNNQLDLFKRYHKILLEWNEKINLISRKGKDSIIEKHFLDSIIFLPEIENLCTGVLQYPSTIFDIGSGGGFPAIPLAIMKPEWTFTLCESIKKKAGFLTNLVGELELKNKVEILNTRAETCRGMSQQNKYDFVTARAIAKLDLLIKYSLPLLKKGGYLLAYKARDIDEEIKNIEPLIKKNKLKLEIFTKELNGVERKLVVIQL